MKIFSKTKFKLPKEVKKVGETLIKNGYQAYLVGGCVRDMATGVSPKDWDIATNAKPEKIQNFFEDSVYENNFGTVGVKTNSEDLTLKIIEVTTFRVEGIYSDKRRPDEVKFVKTIEEDLGRRDFTINAFAIDLTNNKQQTTHDRKEKIKVVSSELSVVGQIIDPFGGEDDLNKKMIRAVGVPEDRFEEDALRLLRAVRFSAQLGFSIEKKTGEAIEKKAKLLKHIAQERIRDEFQKLILTERAADGVFALESFGLLPFIIPELQEGVGCKQNKHHVYEVFEHNVRALEYAAKKNYSLEVRLASLLHDFGKPRTKRGRGENSTFHGHEVIGARMAREVLARLAFPKGVIEKVCHLIRYHMFYYNVGEVSESGVRRFLARVGTEHIDDILKVREADRIGSRVPKAFPYKLRHLLFMIEKVKHDPLHPKMLKLRGDDLMKLLHIDPGPKVGMILSILLEDVLDDSKRNTHEYLIKRAKELGELTEKELKTLAKKAQEKKDEAESGIEEEMKKKYYVK